MLRIARLVATGEKTVYHVMQGTVEKVQKVSICEWR